MPSSSLLLVSYRAVFCPVWWLALIQSIPSFTEFCNVFPCVQRLGWCDRDWRDVCPTAVYWHSWVWPEGARYPRWGIQREWRYIDLQLSPQKHTMYAPPSSDFSNHVTMLMGWPRPSQAGLYCYKFYQPLDFSDMRKDISVNKFLFMVGVEKNSITEDKRLVVVRNF